MPPSARGTPGKTLILVAVLTATILGEASAEPVTTIRLNGDSNNRVDIVILGDGYTESELDKYASDVETLIQGVFAQEPFRDYERHFNVHRVDVTSPDSGADHPERTPPELKDTALDATYDCFGIRRLVCVNHSTVNTVLSNSVSADMRDVVIVLINDPEYGGSGGALAVVSMHPAAADHTLHELGHSFGLLADEYGGPPPPACDASVEPAEANVTTAAVGDLLKWSPWIDLGTPIPTAGPTFAEPGLYEGARYCDTGLFRPTYNSKMRSLGQPFEQVNSEQLVKRVYNWVSPIDGAEPTDSSVMLAQEQSQTFRVQTVQPVTGSLEIVWFVDGQPMATDSELTLSSSELAPGSHTVEVVVSDPTPLVRSDPAQVLMETRRWDVTVDRRVSAPDVVQAAVSSPPATARVGAWFEILDTVRNDGDANAPASTTRFYFSIDTQRNRGDRHLIGTRAVPELIPGEESTGPTRVRIPRTLSPGTYFLLACADDRKVLAEQDLRNNCRASETPVTVDP